MLRNAEYKAFAIFSAAVCIILTYVIYLLSPVASAAAGAAFILLNLAYYAFSSYRYNEIKKLSQYLQTVYSGTRVLDIRSNTEGELSILKNDIYKITVALQEQTDRLSSEKALLASSLGDISHQLKTPLTGAIITAELLQTENLTPEKAREFAKRISTLLEKLNWLVAALLKLSRLDAGAISFTKNETDVKRLLEFAAEPLLISAELKNIEIEYQLESAATWNGDEYWTAQAISNIIKNCVEHSPQNSKIIISVENTPLYCKIKIKDSAGGIAEHDLPHIFERFYKGRSGDENSAGIGLALCKTVIEKQGGAVEVQNYEKGALFTIYLNKLIV